MNTRILAPVTVVAALTCAAISALAQTTPVASRLTITRPTTIVAARPTSVGANVHQLTVPTPPPRLSAPEYAQMAPQIMKELNLKSFPTVRPATGLDVVGNVVNVGLGDASAGLVNVNVLSLTWISGAPILSVWSEGTNSGSVQFGGDPQGKGATSWTWGNPTGAVVVGASNAPAGSYLITCYVQTLSMPSISYQVGLWPLTTQSTSANGGTVNVSNTTQTINIAYVSASAGTLTVGLTPSSGGSFSSMAFYSCDFLRAS
jgi:hypothetical protein